MIGTPEAGEHHALDVEGARLLLLAGRALLWTEPGILCVADVHFGKAAAFRALGQPVPAGTTGDNLARLDALLTRWPVRHVVFLGDFLHARAARAPEVLAQLQAWRDRHARLECTLVRGNHDRQAGDPPDALGIEVVDEPWRMGPLALRHLPLPLPGHHVLAGHVHPVFHLRARARQQLRLPCFEHSSAMTVLPAFGAFTGGMQVTQAPGKRIFVTDGVAVWAVPSRPGLART